MKTRARLISTLATLLGPTATAFAAGGREDNSGIFVWIFLGFCALIVVAQLLPAVFVVLGFAKGVKKVEEPASETVRE
jgi:hypothetical protein